MVMLQEGRLNEAFAICLDCLRGMFELTLCYELRWRFTVHLLARSSVRPRSGKRKDKGLA